MKVFLFAGQSNAQGYGNRLQLNPVPTWAQTAANGWTGAPTVSCLSGFQYQKPTLSNFPCLYNGHNCGLIAGVYDAWGVYLGQSPKYSTGLIGEEGSYGPELSFMWKWKQEHLNEEVAVIKCCLGGSAIATWLPGGAMWTILSQTISLAISRLIQAGKTIEWAGFIWMQGESGASGTYAYLHPQVGNEYKDQLRTFLSSVRGITSSSVPCIIGRIGNHMLLPNIIGTVNSGENTPENRIGATNLRRSQQVEVGGDTNNSWFSTDNLPVLQDGNPAYWYHHTGPGYLGMGESAFSAWKNLSNQVPPPSPTPLQTVVKFDGVVDNTKTAVVKLNGIVVGGNEDLLEINILNN